MEIDFSPLAPSLNYILIGLMKVLGIPFLGALAIGFILLAIKVPKAIVIPAASLLFVFGMLQMFKILDF